MPLPDVAPHITRFGAAGKPGDHRDGHFHEGWRASATIQA